jgi:hypothetical protein
MSPLGCAQLGTTRFPVYHGGGLLPERCDKRTIVLAPGLFAPKGNWAQRNLTVEEILIAKDCGRVAVDLLGAGTLTNTFLQSLLPGKCLIGLADRWGCNNGGGNAFFSIPKATESTRPPAKRPRKESVANAEEAKPLGECGPQDDQEDTQADKDTSRDESSNLVPTDTVLEDVSRQNRERKAVKADGAAVPEYLWTEHLIAGSKVKA